MRTAVLTWTFLTLISAGLAWRLTSAAQRDRQRQQPVLDPASDSLSLVAAAHLSEFDVLRREAEIKIQQFEQTYIYLYAFIGAILASQFFLERYPDLERGLRTVPIVYPVVALILLWFPLNAVVTLTNIALVATYVATVLSPKLTALSEHPDRQTEAGRAYLAWQRDAFPAPLRGQLCWESFLTVSSRRRSSAVSTLMLPLSILRVVMLYTPVALVMARYVAVRDASQASSSLALVFEVVALIVIVVVAVVSAFVFVVEMRDVGWFHFKVNRWRTRIRG
jgi:hypothetical protein